MANTNQGKGPQGKNPENKNIASTEGQPGNLVHLQSGGRKVLVGKNKTHIPVKDFKVEEGAESLVHFYPMSTQVGRDQEPFRIQVKTLTKAVFLRLIESKVKEIVKGLPVFNISSNTDEAIKG